MRVLHVFTQASTAQAFFDSQFKYLTKNGYQITIVAGTEPSNEFCIYNSIQFVKIDVARRIDIQADLVSINELVKLIRREKFDAVFGHTPKGALVAMCAAWLSRVKVRVYYRHGLIYTTANGLKRRIFKAVERLTACLATNIVNVSPSLSRLAVKDGLNSDKKQTVIGSGTCGGIDTVNTFNPALLSTEHQAELKKTIVGDCDFVVGFCGRLCRDKGIAELVEGFKLFTSKHPDIKSKLLLIGAYDNRDVLDDSVKEEIENNPDIVSIGRQDKSKLPSLYALMDVFVFPSYREGFGMCVIEASAMEVPVLVSRSHGCIDSIKENVSGKYIDISADSIAKELGVMLNPVLRNRLGVGGRDLVVQSYDQKSMWPLIEKFYDATILNYK
ncbi:MAG: glycosyltransferase [Muribaculum sp.]|nr:glycosyltransferase [Muribaculum sp.]